MSECFPVNMAQHNVGALVIHPSDHRLLGLATEQIESLGLNGFDRLAIPEPSKYLLDENSPVMDWVRMLEGKHGFQTVYLMEEKSSSAEEKRLRSLAQTAIKMALTSLTIELIGLVGGLETAKPADALVITCVDFRFQEAYEQIRAEYGFETFDLLAIPGGSKGLENKQVRQWVETLYEKDRFNEVLILNHWDCAAFGGSAKHGGDNAAEADEHFQSQAEAEKQLRKISKVKVRYELLDQYGPVTSEEPALAA